MWKHPQLGFRSKANTDNSLVDNFMWILFSFSTIGSGHRESQSKSIEKGFDPIHFGSDSNCIEILASRIADTCISFVVSCCLKSLKVFSFNYWSVNNGMRCSAWCYLISSWKLSNCWSSFSAFTSILFDDNHHIVEEKNRTILLALGLDYSTQNLGCRQTNTKQKQE